MGFCRANIQPLLDRANQLGVLYSDTEYDEAEDKIVTRYVQDVEPILKLNREMQVHGAQGFGPGIGERIASIPNIIVHKWLVEEGINVLDHEHWPKVKAKLNSGQYAYLKTTNKTI